MDHVLRLIRSASFGFLFLLSPAFAQTDYTTYALPSSLIPPYAPTEAAQIDAVLLQRCSQYTSVYAPSASCQPCALGSYRAYCAMSTTGSSLQTFNAIPCTAGSQPNFRKNACQPACPSHLNLPSGDATSLAVRLRVRATVSGIDANKRITYIPATAGFGITCYSACAYQGGYTQYGPLKTFVEDVNATTIGSPVDVSTMHLGTGESCEVGQDGSVSGYVDGNTSETSPAGPGSPLSGSGGNSPQDSLNIDAVKQNTGADGPIATRLGTISDRLAAVLSGAGDHFDCASDLTCTGDAARCMMLFAARKTMCQDRIAELGDGAKISQHGSALIELGSKSIGDVLKAPGDPHDIGAHMVRPRFLGTGACPAPIPVNFFGRVVEFAFDPLCALAPIMGFFLIAGASYIGLRIFLPAL